MKRTVGAGLGIAAFGLLLSPLLFLVVAGSAVASCVTGGPQPVDDATVAEVAARVERALGSAAEGLDEPAEQVPNAQVIQATGVAMGVHVRGQVVALVAALQESRLRNLGYGDRDSLGLFQQRPSQGWGTAEEIMQPAYASTKFYEALREVPGWESLTIAQAAQAVQKSAFPDAYDVWEPLATALQEAIEPLIAGAGEASFAAAGVDGCATVRTAGADVGEGIPAGVLPAGYRVPQDAPPQVQTAIRWALGQLGTPYQWGGTCTDPHGPDPMGRCDCSSLIQQAYNAAGIDLPRTTYTQVTAGEPVSIDDLRPGDLLFTEGSADAPNHVGMHIGQGLVVHAPESGDVVRVASLDSWQPQIVAARRVV
ncbi:C40 family peptidase [Streptomyces sp. B6B3]|uniref:C40 family peptidase n=1 Tax=Streptomyces sp. B6B3 TaxID=3153570 RepID=UPI00325D7AD0